MNLEKTLEEFGLDEKQAKVFLACLELGSASVQQISRQAELPRTTCYEVLVRLREQGLVSTFKKKTVQHFSVENPQQILTLAKEKMEVLERVVPELRARYGAAKYRPTVRFYQGKLGMKLILEEMLAEAREFCSFGSAEDLFTTLDKAFPEFVARRVQKKIPVRVILRASAKAQERQQLGAQELRRVKIIPARYEYHSNIFLWENKVAMFSFRQDLTAIVIESVELAKAQQALFDALWDSLSPKTTSPPTAQRVV